MRRLGYGVVLVGVGLVGIVRADQPEAKVECNGDVRCEPIALRYGEHTSACGVDPSSDSDQFTFEAKAGDRIRLIVGDNNAINPRIELLDPSGTEIAENTDCGGCTIGKDLDPDPAKGRGTYLVLVSDTGLDSKGGYVLQLERIHPPPESALVLEYDSTATDTISPSTDTDFFKFQGVAGTRIRLIVGDNNDINPHIELLDPSGTEIAENTDCGGCTIEKDLDPDPTKGTGSYLVLVSDTGLDSTGAYQISLQCIGRDCPPCVPPLPVEPNGDGDSVSVRPPIFVRGNASAGDDVLNITDGVFILNWLFLGGPEPSCKDSADVNDDGVINVTDPVVVFNYLFLGGPPPAAPFPDCGLDPTDDEGFDCTCDRCVHLSG